MKRKLGALAVRVVTHYARHNMSHNLFALLVLPAAGLGFLWGYCFIALRHALDVPQLQPLFTRLHIVDIKWPLAALVPLVITYFLFHPFCRGLQVLLPDTFPAEELEETP